MPPNPAPQRVVLEHPRRPEHPNRWRTQDRRTHERFLVLVPAEYAIGRERGSATTLNLSSQGLSFRTDRELPVGCRVQVWIDWPARPPDGIALRLTVVGRVLRSNRQCTAIGIVRHDYHLRSGRG